MREGPAHGRASHRPQSRPAKSRGVKGSIPQYGGRPPRDCPGGWRRSRHQRDNRLQSSGHHPPLAIPFLAPIPVFEINPRGVGLRASPCRRADSAPFEEGSRTHPVMSASLRACGVLWRGGWSPASKTGAKQMSRKDAHAFASTQCVDSSPPRSWSRSSSSRQGMEPSAPSPPMKSTATRFKWSLRSTRGLDAHGFFRGQGVGAGPRTRPFPCQRFGRPES